jgi:hypothetical protein
MCDFDYYEKLEKEDEVRRNANPCCKNCRKYYEDYGMPCCKTHDEPLVKDVVRGRCSGWC